MNTQPLIKPNKLSPGDTIAAITLSWGGAALFPYRYEIGKDRLEKIFGLNLIETKHALRDPEWVYKNPQARAADLMEAFSNPNVKGIFSIIGGDDSIRLLPYIDYDIIRNNPKIFLGFSDSTVTHFICLKAGLGTFYGPAILTAFSENINMHQYTVESLKMKGGLLNY
jgi:muramoyltetrapeptide carboxypeptidase LdcA involved in peptidoglycan recycling